MTSISLSPTGASINSIPNSSLDTNGDGVISAEELAAADKSSGSPRLKDPTVESENAASGVSSQAAGDVIAMLLSRADAEAGDHQQGPLSQSLSVDAATEDDDTVSLFDVLKEMSQVIAAYAAHAEAAKGEAEQPPRASLSL